MKRATVSAGAFEGLSPARFAGLSILVALLLTILYGQTIDDEWHLDDQSELHGPGIQHLRPEVKPSHYRGIVTLWTWALNYKLSGDDPLSYHVMNVAIHFFNSLLVYLLARELTRFGMPRFPQRSYFPLLTALLFATHPLATQAVSYVSQRSTSLTVLFSLAAIVLYLRSRRSVRTISRLLFLALSLALYQTALHAKHVSIVVPAVLVLLEAFNLDSRSTRRSGALFILPFCLLAALRIADFVPRHVFDSQTARIASNYGRSEYLLSQAKAVAYSMRLAVFPVGQSIEHDISVARSVREPAVAASIALIVLVLIVAIHIRKTLPAVAFGVLLFFVALLPTSSVVPSPDLFFEHRAYFSLVGFSIATAGLIVSLHRFHRSALIVSIALLLTYASLTWSRNRVWDSEVSLWSDAVAAAPQKARPHVNLGLALQERGNTDEALAQYQTALSIEPGNTLALNNLANLRRQRGDPHSAIHLLQQAVSLDPRYFEGQLNLGNAFLDVGQLAEAEAAYRRALSISPASTEARYNLAKCFEKGARMPEAAAEYRAVVKARPDDCRFQNDLGCAELALGRLDEAQQSLSQAVRLCPQWEIAFYNLGLVHEAMSLPDLAIRDYQNALRLNPGLAAAKERIQLLISLRAR